MKHLKMIFITLLCCLVTVPSCFCETEDQEGMTTETVLASLNFQEGQINLNDNLVTLSLPETYRYLSPEDAEKVIVDAWGNPPGRETMGMIVPADRSVLDEKSWAVIVSYEEEGYVSDEDAEKINYDDMLTEMKKSSEAINKERVEAGYEPIEFVGWGETPYYDKDSHKLYWAKELRFGEAEENTLNYNIRILGRKGVLLLNIVAGMSQFQEIKNEIPVLLGMTEFNPGNRYADFNPDMDKIAAYGIGALIAGKIAANAGLLAKLGAVLFAFKKFLLAIPLVIAAFFKRRSAKKQKEQVFRPSDVPRKEI